METTATAPPAAGSAPATSGPLPRGYTTPECRTGADRWPDLHEMCHHPGYQNTALGWVPVPCACNCHQLAEPEPTPS